MAAVVRAYYARRPGQGPLPHVWLGASIENDRWTGRADAVRETPATVRFISAEPLLGPLPSLDLTGIDWLIVGGESGAGARPMDHAWARDLRDRAKSEGVAFFFKQWGGRTPKAGGRDIDGRTWDEMPPRRLPVPHDRSQLREFGLPLNAVPDDRIGEMAESELWARLSVAVEA